MNNALGATSILVTHDVPETFAIADYVYFIANGKIAAEGTPADLMKSEDLFVRQFIDAQPDGPVPFHYPGKTLQDDFGIKGAAS
jgi:phospholipid/cholesterol/gamma-HCH transport system ATP-binding protein